MKDFDIVINDFVANITWYSEDYATEYEAKAYFKFDHNDDYAVCEIEHIFMLDNNLFLDQVLENQIAQEICIIVNSDPVYYGYYEQLEMERDWYYSNNQDL